MRKNLLSKVQYKILRSIKTDDWFESDDVDSSFANRESQCFKMSEKGYLDRKVKDNGKYDTFLYRKSENLLLLDYCEKCDYLWCKCDELKKGAQSK